ncbi:hypothetical protein LXL04_028173 [Taraxacum kok-saghyz]
MPMKTSSDDALSIHPSLLLQSPEISTLQPTPPFLPSCKPAFVTSEAAVTSMRAYRTSPTNLSLSSTCSTSGQSTSPLKKKLHGFKLVQPSASFSTVSARKATLMASPPEFALLFGVGGHFSGGGYGNMMSKYGLSVDNIIDAEIIDVNCRLLNRESMGEDLF